MLPPGRLSFQALLDKLDPEDPDRALVTLGLDGPYDLQRVQRYLRGGVTEKRGEELAVGAGLEPLLVWHQLAEVEYGGETEADRWTPKEESTTAGTFTSRRACELVGLSYRQIDYLIRYCGFRVEHEAQGSGRPRRLSSEDLRRLDVFARIQRAGLYRQDVGHLVQLIDDQWADGIETLTLTLGEDLGELTVPVRSVETIVATVRPEYARNVGLRGRSDATGLYR